MVDTVNPWLKIGKFDPLAAALADGHYSRRTPGSPQFMPPGQTVILRTEDARAVFGWWRPHPRSGIRQMNGLDGWTCTIFRNTSSRQSSDLVLWAEVALRQVHSNCGPDGLLTYVWDKKIQSRNPGYCFKCAGWVTHPTKPRSADGKKTLLCKPWGACGLLEGA